MKNFPSFFLFSAVLFTLSACQKDPTPPTALSAPVSAGAVLSWQECYDFSAFNTTVCFTDANEYRCPCDVDCVWAGSVDYTLQIKNAGQDTTISLQPPGNPTNAPSSTVVGHVTISIEEPAPVNCTDYGNYEQYKLKVVLTSAKGEEF
ncbi:MAG: hypothetical protein IPL27_12375 [Lewinellaceae bacterium]|nr:hypothetical protein [Lewinellaceae bacterium]MCC6279069.1 hypothetical protein [Saprospiraceae bacterium]